MTLCLHMFSRLIIGAHGLWTLACRPLISEVDRPWAERWGEGVPIVEDGAILLGDLEL